MCSNIVCISVYYMCAEENAFITVDINKGCVFI